MTQEHVIINVFYDIEIVSKLETFLRWRVNIKFKLFV